MTFKFGLTFCNVTVLSEKALLHDACFVIQLTESIFSPSFAESMFDLKHIRMMQIDCEVTNTQMLRVSEADIPAHVRPSAFRRYANATTENGNAATANDSSSSGSSQSNIASSRSKTPSSTFHNSSRDDQNSASASQASFKPYVLRNGYPEKLALSPSQIHKLNSAFLRIRKENVDRHDNSTSFVVQNKPTKLANYP